MEKNILDLKTRAEFREWLTKNCLTENECWLCLKRGKPTDPNVFYYIDAVEEALCFGWIDGTQKPIDGVLRQRFSPRKKNSSWTELNKERVRRLEKLGLMTDNGRAVLPTMDEKDFKDDEIESELEKNGLTEKFNAFPPLYRRIRVYNLVFLRKQDATAYKKSLARFLQETEKGKTYGEWNDYGRLLSE